MRLNHTTMQKLIGSILAVYSTTFDRITYSRIIVERGLLD